MVFVDNLFNKDKKEEKEAGQEKEAKKETFATDTGQRADSNSDSKIKPLDEMSFEDLENANKKLITSYDTVKIYKIENQPILHYEVPVPKASSGEQIIINTIKEAATRLINVAPYKIRDEQQRRNVYFQKVMEIITSSPELKIAEGKQSFYANAVVTEMVGFGLIDSLLKDDGLEEIMIIGPKKPVYVFHREYETMTTNIVFYDDKDIVDLISRIARYTGRRIDYSQPLLDARLSDGSRINATIPPISVSGSTLTIRKFRKEPYTVLDLINNGTCDLQTAAFLWLCVDGLDVKPANLLIAGGTGSGKTTTLNVLSSFIPQRERIITIEDTAELNLPLTHWIRLEARPPGIEGTGEIDLDILTKNALRMRPDRVIVGEVRHKEALALFTAMNTGHDGCMGTIHANSAQETIIRVTAPPMEVPQVMLSGLDMIVVQQRIHDKKKGTIRRVTEIAEVSGVLEGNIQTQKIYEWDPRTDKLEDTSIPSRYLKKIANFSGKNVAQVTKEISNRAQFLKALLGKNLKSQREVSAEIQKYYDLSE
jgi:flagellar protein FlaI